MCLMSKGILQLGWYKKQVHTQPLISFMNYMYTTANSFNMFRWHLHISLPKDSFVSSMTTPLSKTHFFGVKPQICNNCPLTRIYSQIHSIIQSSFYPLACANISCSITSRDIDWDIVWIIECAIYRVMKIQCLLQGNSAVSHIIINKLTSNTAKNTYCTVTM